MQTSQAAPLEENSEPVPAVEIAHPDQVEAQIIEEVVEAAPAIEDEDIPQKEVQEALEEHSEEE